MKNRFGRVLRAQHVEFSPNQYQNIVRKYTFIFARSTSQSKRIPSTVNYRGRFRNNPKDQAEIFNEYFEDQFSDISKYDVDIDYSNDIINNIDFSTGRVRKLLKDVNVNKSVGPDGIHGKVLKNCRDGIAYPLASIFKISYNMGQIPNEWKLANVVPVHKKGPKTSVENYRPISLTCLVMKVFEKIVRDELLSKCIDKLNQNQHGFLPQKSCTTQMVGYIDSISLSINDNIRTDVVYFDFEKAFDSVNHDIILTKLKCEFKIDGTLLKFIMNYLKDRKQCVVIGGTQSDLKRVKSGVPQGSILGPLFFVLFINDMSTCISEDTNIALYADDTKIWRRIENWCDHETLQCDIDALHGWAVRNKMKFHPKKCKVLSISNKATESNVWSKIFPFQTFFYTLDGIELDFPKSEKDLGIVVTNDLSWEENVLALCVKASSRLGLMKRTLRFIKDRKQKRAFYLALIRSLFEHGSIVWSPTTVALTEKVESIQRRAVKWILGEQDHHYNDVEYLSRLRDLDLMPMDQKFKYTDLVVFHQIYNKLSVVELPHYLTALNVSERGRLRLNVRPPDRLGNTDQSNFRSGFFFRTHSLWNDLPTELKEESVPGIFKATLKKYMWTKMIPTDPD